MAGDSVPDRDSTESGHRREIEDPPMQSPKGILATQGESAAHLTAGAPGVADPSGTPAAMPVHAGTDGDAPSVRPDSAAMTLP